MRRVLKSHSEVAHIWATQSQTRGEAGNMFFDGVSIFSYGRHFEIARHVGEVVLFNSRSYSNSTSKHQSYTRRAVSHKKVFTVPSMTDHGENARYYLKELDVRRATVTRARSNADIHRTHLESLIMEAVAYVVTFKKEIPAPTRRLIAKWGEDMVAGTLFSAEALAKIKENTRKAKEANAREAEEKRKRQEERRAEAMLALENWAKGMVMPGWGSDWRMHNLPLRLRIKDKRIETSAGAQITLRAAFGLWEALAGGGNVIGLNLDGYIVSGWDGKILTVGCHKIGVDELSKMARALGIASMLREVA